MKQRIAVGNAEPAAAPIDLQTQNLAMPLKVPRQRDV